MSRVSIPQLIAQAVENHRAGNLHEAEALYRHILTLCPDDPNPLNLIGVIRAQLEDYPTALELISRAIAINPNSASYHLNLGRVLVRMDRPDEAIASLRRAQGLNPNDANILTNLGTVLRSDRQFDAAEECFRKALALSPNDPDNHCNLALALLAQNKPDEAIAIFRSALSIKPDHAGAFNNLGNAFMLKRDIPQALAHYRRALELAPNVAMVHHNLGQALLLSGDFENGWPEHEWRTRAKELKLNLIEFSQPLWDGNPLNGQRIFLQAEQGFGDFIQFVRYVPLVVQRGGRVILSCPEDLVELAQTIPSVEQIVRHGQALPEFDTHCSLISLPLRFKTTLETIPAGIPYLHANPAQSQLWKERLQSIEAKLKIGLAWAGRSDHKNDSNRSMRLSDLAPLTEAQSTAFISLQKGDAAYQTGSPPPGLNIVDWTNELHTFADTSALVENLDLIISVDTAVAHLAGAMGKPAWVLLPFNGEWRWLLEREDSPWYPTLRLFRQTAMGDWQTPVNRIVQALQSLAENQKSAS